jgi:hypothetical protein
MARTKQTARKYTGGDPPIKPREVEVKSKEGNQYCVDDNISKKMLETEKEKEEIIGVFSDTEIPTQNLVKKTPKKKFVSPKRSLSEEEKIKKLEEQNANNLADWIEKFNSDTLNVLHKEKKVKTIESAEK